MSNHDDNHNGKGASPPFDSRYYITAPYNGVKGAAWSRRFKPAFIGALNSQLDRFASIYMHLMREDPGAVQEDGSIIPHPGAANSTLRQESELAYQARSRKLYSLIWTHVEDVDMRSRLSEHAGDGLMAWELLEEMANHPSTGLTLVNQNNDWARLIKA